MIGKDSRHVKEAVKLKQKKYRGLQNKYIIEGIRFIE
ncbi:MAG TPA: RNA methyltransferase, partial [Clostridiaceae bacterium]|nr:RNA methyltransferase [Clostridiaceae bacterium]